ncbi:hypothetical protein AX769_18230 [Frondihabitans sp. PAMC 28766]|uniref:hypothetical protein n=1 Tax=Frondihabitans sp. PAMC 28766 TaxID=1795630 RepID=UPI00078C31EA|nr:hypothetical protein [Frondihabitans sp. PAMC 28766]AMM21731.1 hypothetical protein AX769_18230 [Frondihabitans sp. PAMC 28766]
MNVKLPRWLPVGLAALFSLYHLLLAAVSLSIPSDPVPVIVCMVLYAVATAVVLWPDKSKNLLLPVWMACLALAVAVILPLAVASQLDPHRAGGNGYATWYVAAVGTLMVIVSTRRRQGFAWVGVGFLVLHSVIWSGNFAELANLGVVGSVSWVAISHALQATLSRASRDTREFIRAEQEAADWQAAQEAHVNERQFRLLQTGRTARPMLQRIVATGGDLSPEERQECLNLEGAIRDEIRGRRLLSDDVRREVMAARRRGTVVSLLDEGGIDDIDDAELERVHRELADAIRDASADRLIIRTVSVGSEYAVTVVGLSSEDLQSSTLGSSHANADSGEFDEFDDDDDDDGEDEVSLWLQIPRSSVPRESVDA